MKPIPDWSDYSIEQDGRVWSHKRNEYMIPFIDDRGYLCVRLNQAPLRKTKTIHRLIGLVYIDNPNNYPEIDHINRIRTDNRIENLRWCSRQVNALNKGVYKTNKLGQKFIQERENGKFRVKSDYHGINKTFDTYDQAIQFRNKMLGMYI